MPKRSRIGKIFARAGVKRRKYASRAKTRVFRPMSNARRFRKSRFKTAVMRVVNHNAETKEVMRPLKSNYTLLHNTLQLINNNAFYSEVGTLGGSHTQNSTRIGNKMFCKGFKVSLMLENQQYRPLVSYWLYLVRLKAGKMDDDIATKNDIFEGVSTTIPMDYLDTSKCDILYSKKITVRMPNSGTAVGMTTASVNGPRGTAYRVESGEDYEVFTNPQKIMKLYIPINKTIQYRDPDITNDRRIPASYRYQWAIASYDNFASTTGDAIHPVGHLSMTTIMKFTDV